MSQLGSVLSKLWQTQSYRRRGSDGSLQPLEATWQIFGKKNNHFNAIWITFLTILEQFERTKLLNLGNPLKK